MPDDVAAPLFDPQSNFSQTSIADLSKAKEIVLNEIDLELYLRNQELGTIELQLGRSQDLIRCLREIQRIISSSEPLSLATESVSSADLQRNSAFLYEYSAIDKRYYQLRCVDCDRMNFINLLGFSNHCRIQHCRTFLTPEERIRIAGILVEVSQVPFEQRIDHFKREAFINQSLAQLRTELQRNQPENKPKILVCDSESIDLGTRATSCRPSPATLDLEETGPPSIELDNQIAPLAFTPNQLESRPFIGEGESRFYASRKIVVGNLVRSIFDEKSKKHLFKWKLYIRDPDNRQDLREIIDRIVVTLHDSYAPNNIVELATQPYVVTRSGWGEFTAKLQFFFHAALHDKPAVFNFRLSLRNGRASEQYVIGTEKTLFLRIDKRTSAISSELSLASDGCQAALALSPPEKHAATPVPTQPTKEGCNVPADSGSSTPGVVRQMHFCRFCGTFMALHRKCYALLENGSIFTYSSYILKQKYLADGSSITMPFKKVVPRPPTNHPFRYEPMPLLVHLTICHLAPTNYSPNNFDPSLTRFIATITRLFIKELLNRSFSQLTHPVLQSRTLADESSIFLLTPVHIFKFLQTLDKSSEHFDFLTNRFLLVPIIDEKS